MDSRDVPPLPIVEHRACEEFFHPFSGSGLSRLQAGLARLPTPMCKGRKGITGDPGGYPDLAGPRARRPFGKFEPCPGVGGENPERRAGPGHDLGPFMEGMILMSVHGHAEPLCDRRHSGFHLPPKRVRVAVEMKRLGFGLDQELFDGLIGGALSHHKAAAPGAEIGVEGLQAAAQEILAGGPGPAVLVFPCGDHVERKNGIAAGDGGIERGVVGEPEVPAEPVECDSHN